MKRVLEATRDDGSEIGSVPVRATSPAVVRVPQRRLTPDDTVLQSLGYDDILGYILPSILPFVLNIEEIELDERDSALILVLKEKRNDDDSLRSVDQIYKSLPRNEQRRLSKIDLVTFLERLRRTGGAEKVGDKYAIKPDGEARLPTIRWN